MSLPTFLYGTAWKEERTADLVALALTAGFRAIDTANQRKHYNEAGVGEALAAAGLSREALFLQSKFTYQDGQDHRLPYDPEASLPEKVQQSFASTLAHLRTDYLDSYLLHGPSDRTGWSRDDRAVWAEMESLLTAGKTRALGVSNVSLPQLKSLVSAASVPPTFVQNRCYARHGWDREVRGFCREQGIIYQGFSLLTANRKELETPAIAEMARGRGVTVPQLIFRFAQQQGMLPLTGTASHEHMLLDLGCDGFALTPGDLARIETISG